jgi:hypothetical protein
VRKDDGVFFFLQAVDLESEWRDGAARVEVPFPTARVALDVHERTQQAVGLGFDGGIGGGHESVSFAEVGGYFKRRDRHRAAAANFPLRRLGAKLILVSLGFAQPLRSEPL